MAYIEVVLVVGSIRVHYCAQLFVVDRVDVQPVVMDSEGGTLMVVVQGMVLLDYQAHSVEVDEARLGLMVFYCVHFRTRYHGVYLMERFLGMVWLDYQARSVVVGVVRLDLMESYYVHFQIQYHGVYLLELYPGDFVRLEQMADEHLSGDGCFQILIQVYKQEVLQVPTGCMQEGRLVGANSLDGAHFQIQFRACFQDSYDWMVNAKVRDNGKRWLMDEKVDRRDNAKNYD